MSMICHCHWLSVSGRPSFSVLRAVYLSRKSWYSSKPVASTIGVDVHTKESDDRAPKIRDVYGLKSVSNKFVCGEYQSYGEELEEVEMEKRRKLISEMVQMSRDKMANEHEEKDLSFGKVRLDSANKVKYHNQFDTSNQRLAVDIEMDLQPVGIKTPGYDRPVSDGVQSFSTASSWTYSSDTNVDTFEVVSEEQDPEVVEQLEMFFPINKQSLKLVKEMTSSSVARYQFNFAHELEVSKREALKLWDKDMEENDAIMHEKQMRQWSTARRPRDESDEHDLRKRIKVSKNSPLKCEEEIENELQEIRKEVEQKIEKYKERLLYEQENDEGHKVAADVQPEVTTEPKVKSEKESKMSAFDYVQELRKRKRFESKTVSKSIHDPDNGPKNQVNNPEIIPEMKMDSQGFNSFVDYVPELKFFRRDELVWMLKNRIIFNDCGIVAINKPYGLISQGQIISKKSDSNISEKKIIRDPNLPDLLPDLANLLVDRKLLSVTENGQVPKLHLVHRLDKEATGVLILATDGKVAAKISELLRQGQVEKHYYCITKGVPELFEGIINIPIETGLIEGKERAVLRPELREELRRVAAPSRDGRPAVTYYKIRSSHGNAAFIEVVPETGIKHQIRVHLGFGLRCPILGDHKYTYLDKLVPQKLPSDMLQCLNVRQTKVRNIPLHLHCKLIRLPGFGRYGSNIVIQAPIPGQFKKSLKMLKLTA